MSAPDRTTAYASAVVAGEIVAGPHVRMASARHLRDLDREDIWFDRVLAERVWSFGALLKTATDDGMVSFGPLDWVGFCAACVLCWKRPDGRRRFKKAYFECGRASAKTPALAFIALFVFLAERATRPQMVFLASSEDQAGLAFNELALFIQESQELSELLRVYGGDSRNRGGRVVFKSGGRFKIMQAAADRKGISVSGGKPHLVAVDELHLFAEDSGELLNQIESTLDKRRNSLLLIATNSGPNSAVPCWREHQAAVEAAEGGENADDSLFGYVCGLDPDDNPLDEENWLKANPAYPITPTPEIMRKRAAEARANPHKMVHFRRYRACEWVDESSPFVETEFWEAAQVSATDWPSDEELRRMVCVGGVDLGQRRDLTSVALWWFDPADIQARQWVRVMNWASHGTLRKRQASDGTDFREMERLGFIAGAGKQATDWGAPAAWLVEQHERYDLAGVAADSWKIEHLWEKVRARGVKVTDTPGRSGLLVVKHPNGFYRQRGKVNPSLWMEDSIEVSSSAIRDGLVGIRYNPLLTQAAFSAKIIQDGKGNRAFGKRGDGVWSDPLMALVYAAGLMPFERARRKKRRAPRAALARFYGMTEGEYGAGG